MIEKYKDTLLSQTLKVEEKAGLSPAVLLRVAAADTWLLKLQRAESAFMLDLLAWLRKFSLC